jgi:multidrug efflux pump subunit AcrA (membrane-fusion protein)
MFHRHVLLALAVLVPALLTACSNADSSPDPRTQAPLVRVGNVEANVQSGRSFTGVVAARVQSDLGFRVPGKVLERLVDAGQSVRRGQPLMRIDPVDLRLAMRAQAESVAAARAFVRPPRMRRATATSSPAVRFPPPPTTG